jgi:hypothetical protein
MAKRIEPRPSFTRASGDPGAFKRPCRDCRQMLHINQFRKVGHRRLRICKRCESTANTREALP